MLKTYEIHHLRTGEILADNLRFEDVPELFKAYYDWYIGAVEVYERTVDKLFKITSRRDDFQKDWLELIDQLIEFGNIY